ncbi:hypothetical protein ABCR94_02955 [Streptomyces sp. 21So2-11]|uniref:hypothetical protein n=1 Tax=Streptomyces sp. 21So2-11 TaxID=3144408 RepID=UPI003218EB28
MHTRTTTTSATPNATADWLARALRIPSVAHAEWAERGVALLPLGERYDAVRIPAEVMRAARPDPLPDILGPVVLDPYASHFYALVPPGTTHSWRSPLARCLGRGAWLGVPHVERTQPPGLHWVAPMETAGALCSPTALSDLISKGHDQLTSRHP